ncbi:MAG: hypothetical protein ABIM30_10210 [candidate division WOR-3 bacterium]
MATTEKKASVLSSENVLRNSYIEETKVLGVGGFISSKVGHRITLQIQTTNVANDTELYTYFDGTQQLMQIKIIYTTSARDLISSVERVS